MSNYDTFTKDARLVILASLAQERDGSLNSLNLTRAVDALGVRRSTDWVDTQINHLADLGAVTITKANLPGLGEVTIAKLTSLGRNHVEGRASIAGVSYSAEA